MLCPPSILRSLIAEMMMEQCYLASASNPAGRLQMHVLAAVAEFERSVIKERINAGLAAARDRGARLGRPRTLDRRRAEVGKLMRKGMSGRKIAAGLKIPEGSIFSVMRAAKQAAMDKPAKKSRRLAA